MREAKLVGSDCKDTFYRIVFPKRTYLAFNSRHTSLFNLFRASRRKLSLIIILSDPIRLSLSRLDSYPFLMITSHCVHFGSYLD